MMERTVEQIDAEISDTIVKLADQRSALASAERKLAEIKSEFKAQSVRAVNYDDETAQRWLKKAKEPLFDAEFAIGILKPPRRGA